MQLPLLAAAAVGVGLMAAPQHLIPGQASGPVTLVGAELFSTESHVPRYGEPLRAEDVALSDLGRIEGVNASADGGILVVSVGGLWGWGAQRVEVGMDRLRLMPTDEGGSRLVVDLSSEGAEPLPEAIDG